MANVPISAFTVPANTVGIGATGYSLTGSASASFMDLAGTWNTSGTPTAIKLNITDTASNAASLLMDLQKAGVSQFSVSKDGLLRATTLAATNVFGNAPARTSGLGSIGATGFSFPTGFFASMEIPGTATAHAFLVAGGSGFSTSGLGIGLTLNSDSVMGFSGGSNYTRDLILTRRGAANLRLGAADAAAPVAQTLSVQSVVAGTTNTIGQEFRIDGSQGTGTGAGGSLVFRVAPAGSSGSAQNALATVGQFNASGAQFTVTNGTRTVGFFVDSSGAHIGNTTQSPYIQNGGAGTGGLRIRGDEGYLGFSASSVASASYVVSISRVIDGVLGVRGASSSAGGALNFLEQTAPAAPAANQVSIYAEDNGSGKTRLMAIFATGAAQQIAIEP